MPADISPLDVTLEQALELLAQPKARPRRDGSASEPLKVFDASPVTGQPVQLLDGRYGPYVTDGETNASLPRTMTPEETDARAGPGTACRTGREGRRRRRRPRRKPPRSRHEEEGHQEEDREEGCQEESGQ